MSTDRQSQEADGTRQNGFVDTHEPHLLKNQEQDRADAEQHVPNGHIVLPKQPSPNETSTDASESGINH